MFGKKARGLFRGEEKYSCSEAVGKAFQETCDFDDAAIQVMKAFRGGQAPGGVCGAVYAALKVLNTDEQRAAFERAFIEKAGTVNCRELRAAKKLSCHDCVEVAARLASEVRGT